MFRSVWTRARRSELAQDIVALIAIVVMLVGVVIAAAALSAPPAAAEPPEETSTTSSEGGRTVEVWWAMPAGGTPENVTWPQLHLTDPAAAQCGVWYQVDIYKPADAKRFTRDGVLEYGEDHGHAISWRFVYGGDCAPDPGPQPDPVVDVVVTGTPSCEEPMVTPVETTTRTEWVLGEPVVTTRDLDPVTLSEDELAACRGDQPDPRVEISEWSGGTPSCEDLQVEQTRTVTTTTSVPSADGTSWVDGEPVVQTESRTVTYDGPACEGPTDPPTSPEPVDPPTSSPEPTNPPASPEPSPEPSPTPATPAAPAGPTPETSSTSTERPAPQADGTQLLAEAGFDDTARSLGVIALVLLLVGAATLLAHRAIGGRR